MAPMRINEFDARTYRQMGLLCAVFHGFVIYNRKCTSKENCLFYRYVLLLPQVFNCSIKYNEKLFLSPLTVQ